MVRAIQIGLGNWGFSWAQEVIPTVSDVELVAYVDPSEAARTRVQKELGVPESRCFDTLQAAAAAVSADLVIATLRTEAHFPMVNQALDLGFHVLVEKPFAATMGEARAMVEKADALDRILAVSQNYRYHAAPVRAARLVAEGTLGEVSMVSVAFRKHAPSVGYRFWDMPDPLLADMAIHHFDLMRMVLGDDPVALTCRSWNVTDSRFVHHPLAVATVEFSRGTIVTYSGSWLSGAADTSWSGAWSIDCTDGEIAFSSRRDAPAGGYVDDVMDLRPLDGSRTKPGMAPLTHLDRAGTLAATARAIRTGNAPEHFPSGADNLMSLAMVRASILSAAEGGRWVTIPEIVSVDG